MTDSVYRHALGTEFGKLKPELRLYFGGDPNGRPGVGTGIFDIAGSQRRWLKPLLGYLGWRRILFPEFESSVPFEVVNTPRSDGSLDATRTLRFSNGRERALVDTMRIVDGRLHDFLGSRGGLEARFALTVEDGLLRMRSDRLWLHIGPARIRVPQVATVTVTESWVNGKQHVDVRLRSPLVGEWFRYAGSFSYRYQER